MSLLNVLEKLRVIVPDLPLDDSPVRETRAENLRVGRQLLTADGWQTIRGLVMFQEADLSGSQVTVFTDQRDDLHTDGWRFEFGDEVHTRLHPTAEQEYQRRRQERAERKRQKRLAKAAAQCPEWCVEHYDGAMGEGRARNHSSAPETVTAAGADTGEAAEVSFWLERRDDRGTGSIETVGVVQLGGGREDIELTPEALLQLSARLSSMGHRAQMHR
ncbi:hypothetical protein [Actinoplanes sp. NPDC026670]|uniref:DUF6907 domain-containing protein n=1 Tax=Actinoplanes sp. NPDC026670 TaxID=3154700 RepID=UPI0033C27BFA